MRTSFALVLAALALSLPLAAKGETKDTSREKDLCLLSQENCGPRQDTFQERIRRLKAEIAKGTNVYTEKELQRLNAMLKEYEFLYDRLMFGPSSH
ncbi:hypothetical protein [Geomobilimonas luticola]|uniref:Uncharacterized protein n=1 Tax=Geomobilimonas luticola TaxID=1114878 RepID=A0ABS5SD72_9BACT|nr:hypothetical protein [Geomobilimonas luticola]MBT0653331.1 hypothetical protein [Geomobilimonas luticola]